MSKFDSMTDVEYFAAEDEFMEKYNAPKCKPIEVLDLIMRREFAEEILSGEKKVESCFLDVKCIENALTIMRL